MSALELGVPKAAVIRTAVSLLLLVLGLASCDWNAQESVKPLYTKRDVVSDDRIVGIWRRDKGPSFYPFSEWKPDGQFTVEKAPGTDHYRLSPSLANNPGLANNQKSSELHLARIGKYLFADVQSRDVDASAPTHIFGRIFISRDAITLRVPQTYESKSGGLSIFPLKLSGSVAVDSTEKLQKFAVAHAEDRMAFFEVGLCREGVADCEIAVPRELFKQEPKNVDAGYQLAAAYMNRGRFKEAWSTWKRIPPPKLGLRSMHTPLRAIYLAAPLAEWGHETNAINVLDAESRFAFPPSRSRRDQIKAMAALEEQNRRYPGFEGWCGGVAAGYLMVNRPRRVITELKKCEGVAATTIDAEMAASFKARAYQQMGQFQNARREALLAVKDCGGEQDVALSDFAMERYFTAETELKALTRYQKDLLIWRYLALRHLDRESAASELLKDPALDDNNYVASAEKDSQERFEVKGWRPYLRRELDETRFLANISRRKGRRVQPEMCVAYFLVADMHLLDGDPKGAREYFKKATDTHAYPRAEWVIANARVKQLREK